MPLYDIEHICPLTDVQQDAIAAAITKIHTEKFIVPTMFVNVYFRNVSDMTAYIGGKRRKTNKIFCHLRGGGDRKITQFNEVTHELVDMWNSIVKNETEGDDTDKELRGAFIANEFVTGWEAGFTLPKAGEDKIWLQNNAKEFKRRAAEGDEELARTLQEMSTRPEFAS